MNGAVFCVVLLAAASVVKQQVFSSRTAGVRLDVTVVDRGASVQSLTERDFDVFDNGVRQELTLVASQEAELDVSLVVVPSSPEAGGSSLLEQGLKAIARLLRDQDRYGLILATGPPIVARPLLPYVQASPISAAPPSPAAALTDAMLQALATLTSRERRSALIVFTDGAEDQSWTSHAALRSAADHFAAQIVVCGLDTVTPRQAFTVWNSRGDTRNEIRTQPGTAVLSIPRWLLELARVSGGRVVDLRESQVVAQLQELFDELRSGYVITYTPKNLSTSNWHEVRVVLKGRKGTVLTRSGYWAQ
jgi:VWFA-related protein